MARLGPRIELDAQGNPIFIEVIPSEVLRLIKPTDLEALEQLHKFRAVYGLEDPNVLRQFETQYLARFDITTSNPRYLEALEQLGTESNQQRVLVAQARRTAQRAELIEATGGDFSTNVIYVNDDDPCDPCESLNGLEGPLSQFEANNEMPGDVCLGGDNCRCRFIVAN